MSAFETFVQLELPKRPYLETDISQESVLVRRGAGSRQLAGVTLAEGQVLAMVNGELVGATIGDLGGGGSSVRSAVLNVTVAATTWNLQHNLNSTNVIIQVVDANGYVIIPRDIQIVDANNVSVFFSSLQSGTVRVIFLD